MSSHHRFRQKAFLKIHCYFRTCPICGSGQVREFIVCPSCWARVQELSLQCPLETQQDDLRIISLWTWIRDQSRPLSVLLEALKHHPVSMDWQFVAERLSEKVLLHQTNSGPVVFVPCPSVGDQTRNHATQLALSLGRYWNAPVLMLLTAPKRRSLQKQKSRMERRLIHFETNENFSMDLLNDKKVIFVDDIVTTGSTALAGYFALEKPKSFEVWCLAHRRLAATGRL